MVRVDAGVDGRHDHIGRSPHEIPRAIDPRRAQTPLTESTVRIAQIERVVGNEVEADDPVGLGGGYTALVRERPGRRQGISRDRDPESADRRKLVFDGAAHGAQRSLPLGRRRARRERHEDVPARGRRRRPSGQAHAHPHHKRTCEDRASADSHPIPCLEMSMRTRRPFGDG